MKLMVNFLLLLMTLSLTTGCGAYLISQALKKDDDGHRASYNYKPADADLSTSKTACQPDNTVSAGRVEQSDEITLKRHSQRVIRYGCDIDNQPTRDVVLSDQWEEVISPNMRYYIVPKNITAPTSESKTGIAKLLSGFGGAAEPAKDWDENIKGNANNKTTCSYDSGVDEILKFLFTGGIANIIDAVSADKPAGPSIAVDIDLANHAFDMRVTEGLNYIDYTFEDKCPEDDESCDDKVLEEGTLVLNVIYDLKEKGGIQEVVHVDNECLEEKP